MKTSEVAGFQSVANSRLHVCIRSFLVICRMFLLSDGWIERRMERNRSPTMPSRVMFTRGRHNAELVLAALVTGSTIKDAAAIVGVHERTIHRYLKDQRFREAFDEAKKSVLEPSILKLRSAVSSAIDTLVAIHTDPIQPAPSRVGAAYRLISLALEVSEISELRDRLRQLEGKTINGKVSR